MSGAHYTPNPRAHPGLRAIALVELVKGLLVLVAASGLELLGPAPLRRWVNELIHRFQLDPEHGAMAWLAQGINPDSVHLAAAAVLAYGVIHLVEAWGLYGATRPGPRGLAASRPLSICRSMATPCSTIRAGQH